MTDQWDDLVDVLQAETALYRSLLGLLDRERPALMRSHRAEIERSTADKRELIERLQALERRRAEVLGRLAAGIGRPAGELTLSLLALSAPARQADGLQRCRAELRGLMAQVAAENQRSAALCGHIGDLLRNAYAVVRGLAGNGVVYQRGGRMLDARLNGKLVHNEI
jgi:flagellar biosynthesis/type III secretory pathway chaperone